MFKYRRFERRAPRRWLQLLFVLMFVLESFYGPVRRAGAGPLLSVQASEVM